MELLSILGWMASGALIASILFFFLTREEREESRIVAIAKLEIEVESLLYQLEQETNIKRALILKLHNGGARLYAGVTKYTSVMQESHSPKQDTIKHLIQSFPVDRGFSSLFSELPVHKLIPLDIDKMSESSLKRRYIQDNCKTGMLVELVETDSGLYFLDLSSELDQLEFYSKSNYALQEQLINRIRNIYKVGLQKGLLQ